MSPPASESPVASGHVDEGRHATNLELFVDLVFVFAITQITTFIAHDLTWSGVGQGVLLAWLVWWVWSQYVWAGTVVDVESASQWRRTAILASIPGTLLMTIAIPGAYGSGAADSVTSGSEALHEVVGHDTGMLFALSYAVVLAWVIGMQGQAVWADREARSGWLRYAPLAFVSPAMVIIGAAMDGDARFWWWLTAAVVGLTGSLIGTRSTDQTSWAINPSHFAERHALFVIICLGEVLVAIGSKVTDAVQEFGVTTALVVAVIVCTIYAAVLWWTYFAFVPRLVESTLARRRGGDRVRYARDVFTLAHFPMVIGIVFFAVVAKEVAVHPQEPLRAAHQWTLAASLCGFIGALILIRMRTVSGIAPERVVALVIGVGLSVLTPWDGIAVLTCVAAVLIAAEAVIEVRFAARNQGSPQSA